MGKKQSKTDRRRGVLRRRDGDNCWVCGLVMRFDNVAERRAAGKGPARIDASIDHVVPRCDGGSSLWDNLRLAHQHCNSSRKTATVDEMRETMALMVSNWLLSSQSRSTGRPRHVVAYVVALDKIA